MFKKFLPVIILLWYSLHAGTTFAFTHADTLRGSNGNGRSWWDVKKYDLSVTFDTANRTIAGSDMILLSVVSAPCDSMQIDLQRPLKITGVSCEGKSLTYEQEGNVWWLKHPFHDWKTGSEHTVIIDYEGKPREAIRPPWDGGFSWTKDTSGKLWLSVSCQGLGASVWWPCKDAQWDEPDNGMNIRLAIPGNYRAISNGRLVDTTIDRANNKTVWHWHVQNPINNYDVTFYIGDYVHWHDTLMGEKGILDLDFWVLRYNEDRARKQFEVVKQMIHCFEYWMGPYPFYEDGYKLVDAPYLGMEHQGAIAYGNNYQKGYMGFDRSMTGYGNSWDYIIIHESGHEWFGNNVTARDMADNWIHEGITSYSESLFTECLMGREKGMKYSRGLFHNIRNTRPVIGEYGVNEEGPGDIYEKGSAIMHMIRIMTGDDEKFRNMLRGLSKEFYHQVVTTQQVEDYISLHTGLGLKAFFNQYLRTTDIPQLEYYIKDDALNFKFSNTVDGFSLPVTVTAGETTTPLNVTTEWQHIKWNGGYNLKFSNDFLIKVKR